MLLKRGCEYRFLSRQRRHFPVKKYPDPVRVRLRMDDLGGGGHMEQHLRIVFETALQAACRRTGNTGGMLRDAAGSPKVSPCGSNRGRWRSLFAGAPWRPGT